MYIYKKWSKPSIKDNQSFQSLLLLTRYQHVLLSAEIEKRKEEASNDAGDERLPTCAASKTTRFPSMSSSPTAATCRRQRIGDKQRGKEYGLTTVCETTVRSRQFLHHVLSRRKDAMASAAPHGRHHWKPWRRPLRRFIHRGPLAHPPSRPHPGQPWPAASPWPAH